LPEHVGVIFVYHMFIFVYRSVELSIIILQDIAS